VKLQVFVRNSFNSIPSVVKALELLDKFEGVLKREALATELHEKALVIFIAFGNELTQIEEIYEEQKMSPPKARDLPPVAGNIAWARNLFARVNTPMRQFADKYPHVLNTREGRLIVKRYNRLAKILISFELLWYDAWKESVEASRAGLQATLLIRHPADNVLYVNLDAELLQLISM